MADENGEAREVALRFCAAQAAADEPRLKGLMTADLAAIVSDAETRNETIAAEAGADAAPLADGIPFQSMAATAKCAPGPVTVSANLTLVAVGYAVEGGQSWTDRLVLRREEGEMRIDDILFASFPTDTYNAGLRRVLADTFDQ